MGSAASKNPKAEPSYNRNEGSPSASGVRDYTDKAQTSRADNTEQINTKVKSNSADEVDDNKEKHEERKGGLVSKSEEEDKKDETDKNEQGNNDQKTEEKEEECEENDQGKSEQMTEEGEEDHEEASEQNAEDEDDVKEDTDNDSSSEEDDEFGILLGTAKEEEEKATRLLTKHTELYGKTRGFWDSGITKMLGHFKQINATHSTYWYFSRSTQNTFWNEIGQRLIASGSLALICDVATECLRSLNAQSAEDAEKNPQEDRQNILTAVFKIFWNFTDCSEKVAQETCKCRQLLEQMLLHLKVFATRKDRKTRESSTLAAIAIFHNIARREQNVKYLREMEDFMEVLKNYLPSSATSTGSRQQEMVAIMLAAIVVTDVEAHILSTSPGTIRTLLRALGTALEDTEDHRDENGFSLIELLQAVKHLSKNAENTDLLVKEGVLKLLLAGLQSTDQEERLGSIESLWWLSFMKEARERLMKETELLELVITIYRNKEDVCHKAADGMLFQLREVLQKHQRADLRELGESFRMKDVDVGPSASTGHVMLSYSKFNRDLVKQVCFYLKENGIKVWMDILYMADTEDSTSQTMAEAVESAAVFLLCYSEDYKESQPCKQEAEYATKRKKYIIPLRLQRGYEPTGWLGFIIGNTYFYDLSREELRQQKFQDLLVKVRAKVNQGFDEPDASLGKSLQPVSKLQAQPRMTGTVTPVRQWTDKEVSEWLSRHNLTGKKLQALTGKQIAFMVTLKTTAPDRFYQILSSELEVTDLASMADFVYALDNVQ